MKKPHSQNKQALMLQDFIDDMLWDGDAASTTIAETAKAEPKAEPNTRQPNPWQDSQTVKPVEARPMVPPAPAVAPEKDFATTPAKPTEALDERLDKVKSLLSSMPKVAPVIEPKAVASKVKAEPVAPSNVPVERTEAVPAKSLDKPTNQELRTPVEDVTQETNEQARHILESGAQREETRLKALLGDRFQTLIFDVGKLPLAVPLVKLGGIHAYSEEDVTPLFGTPDWFKGILPAEQGNLLLVDTARFIMPEKYPQIKDTLEYKYCILLDDSRWALACSNVREAKMLTLDDIRWSEKGTKKPWFAGMVVDYMCALLEVDALINLLYREGQAKKTARN
ncbi:MAG: chemotaxis protein CheW [Gammaproteobacteria bacterium]|nr:chemotaxis protein CheW [Gammaproteobacteria bacterium]